MGILAFFTKKRIATAPPPTSQDRETRFDNMNIDDLTKFVKRHSEDNSLTGHLMLKVHKRALRIAHFDNFTSQDDRDAAVCLSESLEKDIATYFYANDNCQALHLFWRRQELLKKNVKAVGVGSLSWLIVENKIPDAEVASFVLKPEYSHLLSDYRAWVMKSE